MKHGQSPQEGDFTACNEIIVRAMAEGLDRPRDRQNIAYLDPNSITPICCGFYKKSK